MAPFTFSEHDCIADGGPQFYRLKKMRSYQMTVSAAEGEHTRPIVPVSVKTASGDLKEYLVDKITGTAYTLDGVCLSSNLRRLIVGGA